MKSSQHNENNYTISITQRKQDATQQNLHNIMKTTIKSPQHNEISTTQLKQATTQQKPAATQIKLAKHNRNKPQKISTQWKPAASQQN